LITPQEIRQKALRLWSSQEPLREDWAGEPGHPWEITFGKPGARELLETFSQLRDAVRDLREGCKAVRGFGYEIEFEERHHRQLGRQLVPARIFIPSLEDLASLLGLAPTLRQWRELSDLIVTDQPALAALVARSPLRVLDFSQAEWRKLLSVVRFFQENQRPNLYARQLEIVGIDTKFIESKKRILRELLDLALPPESLELSHVDLDSFERRFGLRSEGSLVRFRFLGDSTPSQIPYTDLSVPLVEFSRVALMVQRVFIVENKVNALAFPPVPHSIVVFGAGYGIRALRSVAWLKDREVFYWGDIDTHGFAILGALREFLPQACSFLMDQHTLQSFPSLWGKEPIESRFAGALRLTMNDEELP